MATTSSDQYVVRCKLTRRDIALVVISVLVLVQVAVIVFILVAYKPTATADLQNKLQMQVAEIEKQKSDIWTQEEKNAKQQVEIEKQKDENAKQQVEIEKQKDEIGKQQDENAKQKDENAKQQVEIEKQQDEIREHQEKLTSIYSELEKAKTNQGVVYVRWGREDCPGNGTETVYSGYAGGSSYTHTGAAVDYVCLPPDPSWGSKKDIRSYAPGYMYGAEYEDPVLFNVPDYNRDVPCAVCRSSDHSTSIMIPARTTCYTGWVEAYHGYLVSGYHDHAAASEYVCVDEDPRTLVGGGSSDENGKLFYQVRTVCGSLKCPPYENDKVLSCVVCMK